MQPLNGRQNSLFSGHVFTGPNNKALIHVTEKDDEQVDKPLEDPIP
jgi:hypothetical protein